MRTIQQLENDIFDFIKYNDGKDMVDIIIKFGQPDLCLIAVANLTKNNKIIRESAGINYYYKSVS